jgi:hypothetical protein
LRFLPFFKIERSGKRRKHQELSERQTGPLRELEGGIEGIAAVAGKAEDERAKNLYSVLAKSLQLVLSSSLIKRTPAGQSRGTAM